MKETSKAHIRRSTNWAFVHRYFVGDGLDVGSGDDPLRADDWPNVTGVTCHDAPDGSSEKLPHFGKEFDFVYASNVLEHMADPGLALFHWIEAVKDGGYVIFTVPDFELYEQRHWPSKWNAGHRHPFSVESVIKMIDDYNTGHAYERIEPYAKIKKIELIDTRYDYALTDVDQTFDEHGAEAFIEVVLQKV